MSLISGTVPMLHADWGSVWQGKKECPLCKESLQKRHFRLLRGGRQEREHICCGCSQRRKIIRDLMDTAMSEKQCVPDPCTIW